MAQVVPWAGKSRSRQVSLPIDRMGLTEGHRELLDQAIRRGCPEVDFGRERPYTGLVTLNSQKFRFSVERIDRRDRYPQEPIPTPLHSFLMGFSRVAALGWLRRGCSMNGNIVLYFEYGREMAFMMTFQER